MGQLLLDCSPAVARLFCKLHTDLETYSVSTSSDSSTYVDVGTVELGHVCQIPLVADASESTVSFTAPPPLHLHHPFRPVGNRRQLRTVTVPEVYRNLSRYCIIYDVTNCLLTHAGAR